MQEIKVSQLSDNQDYEFTLDLRPKDIEELRNAFDLIALRKPSLRGILSPSGKSDWELKATLGATVVQPCVVTLEPVTTRIDEPIEFLFKKKMPEAVSDEDEIEMTEDERIAPLGSSISLRRVFHEGLALTLPPYPRVEGAMLETTAFTEAGIEPMKDEDARPFAQLAALKDKLKPNGN